MLLLLLLLLPLLILCRTCKPLLLSFLHHWCSVVSVAGISLVVCMRAFSTSFLLVFFYPFFSTHAYLYALTPPISSPTQAYSNSALTPKKLVLGKGPAARTPPPSSGQGSGKEWRDDGCMSAMILRKILW